MIGISTGYHQPRSCPHPWMIHTVSGETGGSAGSGAGFQEGTSAGRVTPSRRTAASGPFPVLLRPSRGAPPHQRGFPWKMAGPALQ